MVATARTVYTEVDLGGRVLWELEVSALCLAAVDVLTAFARIVARGARRCYLPNREQLVYILYTPPASTS